MTSEEILQKALKKAKNNGYEVNVLENNCIKYGQIDPFMDVYYTIFSHEFAKAFWGEELDSQIFARWKYHIQKMVLEEKPLKYLEKFLNI